MAKLETFCIPISLILLGLIGFGGYKISQLQRSRGPVALEYRTLATAVIPVATSTSKVVSKAKVYVASKTGSYYYVATCSGAKRISDKNKVWFATKQEAEAKGLKPAKNCPGLSR